MAAPLLRRSPGGAEATRALRVGLAAGREDEIRPRRGLTDESPAGAADEEPAVDTLAEVDTTARVGAAGRTGGIWAQRVPRRTVLSGATTRV